MKRMLKLVFGFAAATVLSALLGACNALGIGDENVMNGTVSLSMGKASESPASQSIACYWVVGRVDVFANGEEVGSESFDVRREVPVTSVTVPVTVPEGTTLFDAAVFTDRDQLVFEGEADDLVEVNDDLTTVSIDLFAIAPALEYCFNYETGLGLVRNRGAADLTWSAMGLDTCDGFECVFPFPAQGAIPAGRDTLMNFEWGIESGEYTCLSVTDGFHEFRVPICRSNFDLGIVCEPPEEPTC